MLRFLTLLICVVFCVSGSWSGIYAQSIESAKASSKTSTRRQFGEDSFDRAIQGLNRPHSSNSVCEIIKKYPRADGERMNYELGEISALCRPFVKYQRKDLDRCGDTKSDPYVSRFTWSSRNEMARKGKANIFTDADMQPMLPRLLGRIEILRASATQLCCGVDESCRQAMAKVEVNVCKPVDDPDQPDACVFGGSFNMPGEGYDAIFQMIRDSHQGSEGSEIRRIASKNLGGADDGKSTREIRPLSSGRITLSSYVSRSKGIAVLEPVILHELGHACSMIKMQQASITKGRDYAEKARRAAEWLDTAKARCQVDMELPEAYTDFWESIGESRELSQCLKDLTVANQKQLVDRPCSGLCPGHYMEESVGIAFSLLLGDLSGKAGSVFPNTCDHVRDGQHPMVSDVVDCLAQHSPRFRDRVKRSYNCK